MIREPSTAWKRITRRAALGGLSAALVTRPGTARAVPVDDASLAGPLGDVRLGAADAKVTLVEYAAVTCTHCAAFHTETWPLVRARWIETGQVRFVLRGYPLNPLDTAGFMLARSDGGHSYYAIIDMLFERQAAWAFVPQPLEALRALMRQAGIDRARFDAVLRDRSLYESVARVHAEATSVLGVHATPTFFVNDERHEGAPTIDALGAIIARAKERSVH